MTHRDRRKVMRMCISFLRSFFFFFLLHDNSLNAPHFDIPTVAKKLPLRYVCVGQVMMFLIGEA